jgi:hypothetical protein
MNNTTRGSRKRKVKEREIWTQERLKRERAIALGYSIDPGTKMSYSSATESYIQFCQNHNFEIEPTEDTFSFYVTYMCHFIKPPSVSTYLSGICDQLEPFYPNIRQIRMSKLVSRTLKGCRKRHIYVKRQKRALEREELTGVYEDLKVSNDHDDLLFLVILFIGFLGVMRLGELVWPDTVAQRELRKVVMRSSLEINPDHISFLLPTHKSDRQFDGNRILVRATETEDCPVQITKKYINSRDHLFPAHPNLFARRDGSIPTRQWFIRRLRHYFPEEVAGHSLRSGGATFYALQGYSWDLIQTLGRWSSEAFRLYIRKHPLFFSALLTKKETPST